MTTLIIGCNRVHTYSFDGTQTLLSLDTSRWWKRVQMRDLI